MVLIEPASEEDSDDVLERHRVSRGALKKRLQLEEYFVYHLFYEVCCMDWRVTLSL
jgi:hypothetical protein